MEKTLQRSRKKKVVAGIAGGLGEYLDIDPVIIRIIIVLITIFHGIGIVIYIIMWIVIPEEPYNQYFTEPTPDAQTNPDPPKGTNSNESDNVKSQPEIRAQSSNGRIIVGVFLIIIGLLFLSERFLPFFDFEFVIAIGMIALGAALLFNFFNKKENKK